MSFDGKILNEARELHTEQKLAHERALHTRREALYTKIPRLREIDHALRNTVRDMIQITLEQNENPEARLEALGEENQALQLESRGVLLDHGYPADYLDDAPRCAVCKDLGTTDTGLCDCLRDIYRTLQAKELSSLLNLGAENFDAFSLSYYDDRTIDPRFGMTARENMAEILTFCKRYADTFGTNSMNLFLIGDPGLGKTFLSTCIAKVVSENGHSVVYDTAQSLFARFEAEKFGRSEDPEEAQAEINRYLSADLLILDDLGTEMTTSFVVSTLYALINTRLLRKKPTIISANYSLEALASKYSPQIMSRLEGEYEVLTFFGRDIRKLKKEG